MPCAILAGLRAANRGTEALIATSTERSDDELVEQCSRHGIRVFRGPLDDVLARYAFATAELPADSVIVRLTADNVVPDGRFVEELVAAFLESGAEYLVTDFPESGLPYGLTGEVFSLAALRRAHAEATNPYDREHVGPWMRRNCRAGTSRPQTRSSFDYSYLRCTIDDEEDYRRVLRLFQDTPHPIQVGWYELVKKLASLPEAPSFRIPYKVMGGRVHSEMTLGTVQLGLDYGIVNRTGKTPKNAAVAMVRRAIEHGVTALDSARAYGDSEAVLGEALSGAWRSRAEVITKFSPLLSLSANRDVRAVDSAIAKSISDSCRALGAKHLSTLLLHGWQPYQPWANRIWRHLLELHDSGVIGVLGASVDTPSEALDALRNPLIRHLQIPLNVLDRRWKTAGVDRVLEERSDVVVHARSVFLQGLLLSTADKWPTISHHGTKARLRQLRALVRRFDRLSVTDLCLAYVRSQPWVTSLVVGSDNMIQLMENLELFLAPKLSNEQCLEIERFFSDVPAGLLNPSQWKLC
jgi:spore coat polysaccharide biosynthesis protein SpsF